MSAQVCVNCHNKKTVNQTDNRLVTESCGHVKCMDCLLHEKAGCEACMSNGSIKPSLDDLKQDVDEVETIETYTVPLEFQDLSNEEQTELKELCVKKKLQLTHIKVESDGDKKKYLCTVCKKTFQSRSQVSYHAYCNGQKKPYHCQTCKQSFASHSHYKYHLRVHSQERAFTCDVCGSSFYQLSKLKRHTLKHTNEKNYACTECDKAFNNHSALRKHALTHTHERPYACAACGRRFRDGSNYKKHVDKHKRPCKPHGESNGKGGEAGAARAHACPRCKKAFYSRKDMRRHAAVHLDSKPFRCKLCSEERRFRRKDNLERHVRNAHPDRSPSAAYECDDTAQTDTYDINEKLRLEILNPLPPLPQELIQKHIDDKETGESVDKKSIIKGNNARESVKHIRKYVDDNETSDSVAKISIIKPSNARESIELIRKHVDDKETCDNVDKKSIIEANNARESVIVVQNADCEKKQPSPENEYVHKIRKAIIPLPPIDQEKLRTVQRGHLPDSVTTAPITNMEIYQKILYGKSDKDTTEVIQNPKMHWRRKMEQDIN